MYRSSPFRSSVNTGYITGLDMCKVCTEAVHSVAVWKSAILHVRFPVRQQKLAGAFKDVFLFTPKDWGTNLIQRIFLKRIQTPFPFHDPKILRCLDHGPGLRFGMGICFVAAVDTISHDLGYSGSHLNQHRQRKLYSGFAVYPFPSLRLKVKGFCQDKVMIRLIHHWTPGGQPNLYVYVDILWVCPSQNTRVCHHPGGSWNYKQMLFVQPIKCHGATWNGSNRFLLCEHQIAHLHWVDYFI